MPVEQKVKANINLYSNMEGSELIRKTGKLIVVTGTSGSGKDTVIEELLKICPDYKRLVTCADRPPRTGETHGKEYYFVPANELDRMFKDSELVEKPVHYGTSRKATPKIEFRKVLYEGQNTIWRIEFGLAARVASGEFFDEQFSPEESQLLKEVTKVVLITASYDTIERRRKDRDKGNYNPQDYSERDRYDAEILQQFKSHFHCIIVNEDGRLEECVHQVVEYIEANKIDKI